MFDPELGKRSDRRRVRSGKIEHRGVATLSCVKDVAPTHQDDIERDRQTGEGASAKEFSGKLNRHGARHALDHRP